MTMHNTRLNKFVTPEGHNFASGNVEVLTMRRTKRQITEDNAPTTLELLKMEGKLPIDVKGSRDNKSIHARHSPGERVIK